MYVALDNRKLWLGNGFHCRKVAFIQVFTIICSFNNIVEFSRKNLMYFRTEGRLNSKFKVYIIKKYFRKPKWKKKNIVSYIMSPERVILNELNFK